VLRLLFQSSHGARGWSRTNLGAMSNRVTAGPRALRAYTCVSYIRKRPPGFFPGGLALFQFPSSLAAWWPFVPEGIGIRRTLGLERGRAHKDARVRPWPNGLAGQQLHRCGFSGHGRSASSPPMSVSETPVKLKKWPREVSSPPAGCVDIHLSRVTLALERIRHRRHLSEAIRSERRCLSAGLQDQRVQHCLEIPAGFEPAFPSWFASRSIRCRRSQFELGATS